MKVDNITIQPKVNVRFLSDKSSESNVTSPQKTDRVELSQKKSQKKNVWKYLLGSLAVIGAGVGVYFLCRKKPPKINIEPPVKPPVEPPVEPVVVKPHWQEYNELKAEEDRLYNQFIAMDPKSDRSEIQEKLSKAAYALSDFKEKAKNENFSILEKKDLSLATEDERWDYFYRYAFPLMKNNEATALDGLEMFDKFGMRRYFKRQAKDVIENSSLEELMSYTPDEPSDKLISKLFDVVNKYAVPNSQNDDLDIAMLRYILTNHSKYCLYKNISEDSLLKAINLFKKMEFWNTKSGHIPNDIKMRYIDRKFKDSPRLDEIKKAVEEMKILWNINNPNTII